MQPVPLQREWPAAFLVAPLCLLAAFGCAREPEATSPVPVVAGSQAPEKDNTEDRDTVRATNAASTTLAPAIEDDPIGDTMNDVVSPVHDGLLRIDGSCLRIEPYELAFRPGTASFTDADTLVFQSDSEDIPVEVVDGDRLAIHGRFLSDEESGSCGGSAPLLVEDIATYSTETPMASEGAVSPGGSLDTTDRATSVETVSGILREDRGCLVLQTDDGDRGLVWSRDQVTWDGDNLLPGGPDDEHTAESAYAKRGDRVEVSGETLPLSEVEAAAWQSEPGEPCFFQPIWVAQLVVID